MTLALFKVSKCAFGSSWVAVVCFTNTNSYTKGQCKEIFSTQWNNPFNISQVDHYSKMLLLFIEGKRKTGDPIN